MQVCGLTAATRWINSEVTLDAIASYDKAIAINPVSADAWNKRGVSLHHLGWYSEAITAHERAIAISPVCANAQNNRGYALGNLGRYAEKAIGSFDEAIALNPDDAKAWYARGFVSIHVDSTLKGLIRLTGRFLSLPMMPTWYARGFGQFKTGEYSDAIASYDKALAINPNFTEARENREIALQRKE